MTVGSFILMFVKEDLLRIKLDTDGRGWTNNNNTTNNNNQIEDVNSQNNNQLHQD